MPGARTRRRGARAAGGVLLAAALLSGVTGCASSSGGSSTSAQSGQHLEVSAFADTLAKSGVVIVDVRTPSEFAAGHLPNAKNLDVEGPDFAQGIAGLDKAGTYAIYCRTGRRSGVAMEQMQSAGFSHVVDLADGYVAWTGAGRPVVTGS